MSPPVPPAASTVTPPWPVLHAPVTWRNLDFIADLHLQASETATFCAWQDFMQTTRADAVFILGDLFEVWIGDDVIANPDGKAEQVSNFEARCAQVLQAAAQRLDIFFIHGNRDFLLGPAFARASGITLLNDPTVLDFAGQRWLLSHGDALCLADTEYLPFRTLVRSAQWQHDFLDLPLAQRQLSARALRTESETHKRSSVIYIDLDPQATCDWLHSAQSNSLIHGHTHRPAEHDLANGLRRIVLSDWDASASPPRVEILRLSRSLPNQEHGSEVHRITVAVAARGQTED